MFDVGFSELLIIFVIGLLILGPERLPRVASQLGRWVGRARRTAHQLRMQLEREMALAEFTKKAQPPTEPAPPDTPDESSADQAQSADQAKPKSHESSAESAREPNDSGAGSSDSSQEEQNRTSEGP